ncbi:Sir2 family NAD-dependent protein deacetylase [Paenibacillus alginolyticus]|uniref:protein acetyllysine N-acetyltransferase n=1 Tax=Paenibacillus alginolyticus TaxID=59839 RepID=A0ABT4G6J9_9BACL|nr:Sir2 family NAD-dependent protein deacetylase [Paenibacillus alginolyticus]MCY9691802.1 Sir2 silent information regulator family NAD-dependent deacetylase [Paenibacillus alginolyticus]MEC0143233.1 Sir2 family NAD-dependent protein deacetylase [Paenibacillus alginolyticus]
MQGNISTRIEKAKQAIKQADYILLGGGAGLSAAAGITYSGKRFTDHFGSFIEKYGFTDLYTSSFYPFTTQEEKWAYWAKHISLNRYETGPTKLYKDLYQMAKDKEYFVITTNVESQFEKAGFPSYKIFEVQGNYSYLQCAKGCHNKRYYNESLVKEMIQQTVDCKIPSELVPRCPVCGGEMDPNLRSNQYFVQDEKWYELDRLYKDFLQKSEGKQIVYLELGVGFNTPGIIRYPFERMTYYNEYATLLRFNKDHPEGFEENKDKTITFTEDMREVVIALMK